MGSAATFFAVWLMLTGQSGPAGARLVDDFQPADAAAMNVEPTSEEIAQAVAQEEVQAAELVQAWEKSRKSGTETAAREEIEPEELGLSGLAAYISRSYRISNEQALQFSNWALEIGAGFDIDPLLLLAVVATESSFNPKAKNSAGAEGLMQIMTRVHQDKFEAFGGPSAAFEPYPNMVVGASILSRLIKRTGSVKKALQWYYGAGNQSSDNGYGDKVFKERSRMLVAAGGDSDKAVELLKSQKSAPGYKSAGRVQKLGFSEWRSIVETHAEKRGSAKQLSGSAELASEIDLNAGRIKAGTTPVS